MVPFQMVPFHFVLPENMVPQKKNSPCHHLSSFSIGGTTRTSAAGTEERFTTPVTRILARWGSAMALGSWDPGMPGMPGTLAVAWNLNAGCMLKCILSGYSMIIIICFNVVHIFLVGWTCDSRHQLNCSMFTKCEDISISHRPELQSLSICEKYSNYRFART